MRKTIIATVIIASFCLGVFTGTTILERRADDVGEFSYESGWTRSILEYIPINSEAEFEELLKILADYSYEGTLFSMSFRVVNGETVGLLIYRTPY